MRVLHVRLPARLDSALRDLAAEEKTTVSEIVRSAIETRLGDRARAKSPSIEQVLADVDESYDEGWLEALSR